MPDFEHGQRIPGELGGPDTLWDAALGDNVSSAEFYERNVTASATPFAGMMGKFMGVAGAAMGIPGGIMTGILLGVSVLSMLLKKKPPKPPPEARGIAVHDNPTDPRAPWLAVYGQPWFRPPLITQYFAETALNTLYISQDHSLVKQYHLSAGPLDGRDLRMKFAGANVHQVITEDSPIHQRELTLVPNSNRRKWLFPVGDVVPSSVVIYLDGVVSSVAGGADGGYIFTDDWTTYTDQAVSPRIFSHGGTGTQQEDPSILSGGLRVGGFFPNDGIVDQSSVTIEVEKDKGSTYLRFLSESLWSLGKKETVPQADIHLSAIKDGKQYFWVGMAFRAFGVNVLEADLSKIKRFKISYKVKPQIFLEVNANGFMTAIFQEPVAAGVSTVSATYRIGALIGDQFQYVFRKGDADQTPVSFEEGEDGARNTYLVGLELTQGALRRYSSANEVDDIVVGLESGPEGYYWVEPGGYFKPVFRDIAIRFKESAAADDRDNPNVDPAVGWVQLRDPVRNWDFFRLEEFFLGTGQWFFSIADLFAFTKTGKYQPNAVNTLQPKKYDVEVVGISAANVNERGDADATRFVNKLYFSTATETRRIGLVLPHHADITCQWKDDDIHNPDALFEVRVAGRKVWVPASGATYSSTTLRPETGEYVFSRNPVWVACDHIVEPIAGGGRYFTWEDIDVASAITAAAHCDDTVTLRSNETETRSLCDIALGEDGARRSIAERLVEILAGSEVLVYWRGKWKFLVDEDSDPVTDPVTAASFTIVEDDDLDGPASLSLQKLEDTPTELSLAFFDNTKEDAADTEPIILGDPQPTPRVEWRREFPAVRRRSQVHRTGTILLQQYRNNRRTITGIGTFGRGLRLLALEPGDIVLFTSTRLGITAARYRVVATGWASDMKPALVLLEHNRDVYRAGFQGPNSAVQPGIRPPPVTTPKSPAPAADEGPPGLRVKALKIRRVSDRRRGRGGGFA